MEAAQIVLSEVRTHCRRERLDDLSDITWEDASFVRNCLLRLKRGDPAAWEEFTLRLGQCPQFACAVREVLETAGLLELVSGECAGFEFVTPGACLVPFTEDQEIELLALLSVDPWDTPRTPTKPTRKQRTALMYIELKLEVAGPARIGRVRFSKTGRTLYYRHQKFRSLKGAYKANYFDVATQQRYWISKCRKDGRDTLYPGRVEIDEDARAEYWCSVRDRPDLVKQKSFASPGKH